MTRALVGLRRAVAAVGRFGEHRGVRHGLWIAGAVFVVFQAWLAGQGGDLVAYDAHAYYNAAALDDPYRSTIQGGFDATGGLYEYKYPPVLAQVLAPVRLLPWPVFCALWMALLIATFFWLAGRWSLPLLLFPPVLGELWLGNINLLIAAAIVLSFRRPALWGFVLVTKATPGVGLLWHVVRRDWWPLVVALAATAAIVLVSFVLAPGLWADFVASTRTQLGATVNVPRQAVPVPLPLRLAIAAVLVVIGARTDRAWLVPIAAAISVPFAWWNVFAILVACVPLASWRPEPRRAAIGSPTAVPT